MLNRYRSSIAYRMTASVLAFSLLLAVASTLGLYLIASREEADKVEMDLRQLATTNIPGINESLWVMDMPALRVQITSLLNIPHVVMAQVEANGRILVSAGDDRPGEAVIRRTFPLNYNLDGRVIPQGNLHLRIDYGDISKNLLSKAHERFLLQLGQIVLVAVFMLVIFRQIVTRRLVAFESHIAGLKYSGTDALALPKPLLFTGRDELDMLVQAFNDMSGQLRELIADMKQRESDLHRLSSFQRTILENAAYAIIATDPDGCVTSFNHAAEELLGYRATEVVGTQTPVLWHDPEEIARRAAELTEELGEAVRAGFEALIARARHNLPDENEWTFIRKDGTRTPILLSVTALKDQEGEITGFVGLVSDLTERKQAEEALVKLNAELEERVQKRTAELEEKNRDLEQMNKLFVGRELRMMELKERIRELGGEGR